MNIIERISKDLNVPKDVLIEGVHLSRKLVKKIKIPKNDGTYRAVYHPAKKTKLIQYWLINNMFSSMKVHKAATAYIKGSSAKKNAIIHKRSKYFLKLDFKDFFPSIIYDDFKHNLITSFGNLYSTDDLEIIRLVCFYKGDILPIGYPSSPIISNVVMYDFDKKIIERISDKEKYGTVYYSRYADDLTFSTNLRGACNRIKNMVERIVREIKSPRLKLNTKKTVFASSSGGSALITGLRVCHDGHLTIHRKYKDKVRLLLSLYEKDRLGKDEIMSLRGHILYIRFVDGAFYTKLQKKYFKSIYEILKTSVD